MRKYLPALVALATVTVWGVNFTLLKDSLAQFDPLPFTWLRYVGMLVLAWTVVLVIRTLGERGRGTPVADRTRARHASPLLPPRRDAGRAVAAGVVGFSGYIVLSLVGLSFTTAFSNALMIAAAPLVTALLLWAGGGERLGWPRVLGLGVGALGVAVFMADKLAHGLAAAGLGDVLSLGAAALFATYTVLVKPLAGRHPATSVTAWTLTAGAPPVLLMALPSLAHQDWARVQTSGWLLLAWAIVVPVYLLWTVWSWVSARAGVAATNAFLYLVPVVSGISSFFLLGEGFGPLKLGGAGLVLTGLVLGGRRSGAFLSQDLALAKVSDPWRLPAERPDGDRGVHQQLQQRAGGERNGGTGGPRDGNQPQPGDERDHHSRPGGDRLHDRVAQADPHAAQHAPQPEQHHARKQDDQRQGGGGVATSEDGRGQGPGEGRHPDRHGQRHGGA